MNIQLPEVYIPNSLVLRIVKRDEPMTVNTNTLHVAVSEYLPNVVISAQEDNCLWMHCDNTPFTWGRSSPNPEIHLFLVVVLTLLIVEANGDIRYYYVFKEEDRTPQG